MRMFTNTDVVLEFESKHTVRLVLENDTFDKAHYSLIIVIKSTQLLEQLEVVILNVSEFLIL
jgi:hypothetical protein